MERSKDPDILDTTVTCGSSSYSCTQNIRTVVVKLNRSLFFLTTIYLLPIAGRQKGRNDCFC